MKIVSVLDQKATDIALKFLNEGEIVIFPSETCYGVAVDATNPDAVSKLLEYKKRPEGKAISVAVSSKKMAEEYVELNSTAENLYKEFLPGAVTIISKSKSKVDPRLESEAKTLGVRIPNYKFLLELLERFGKPITATSANSAGKKTPYSINDILENISEKQMNLIGLIIEAKELPHNPPTTVIDTTTEDLAIYRQGRIDPKRISNFASQLTNSAEQTIEAGKRFMESNLEMLKTKSILVLLNGELGAGKTHFTKGIAEGLKITRLIKSPTYNYVNEYKIDTEKNTKLFHFDAWRIQSREDLELLGFEKWFAPGNVIVVEWPTVIMNLDAEFFDKTDYFYVDFVIQSDDTRDVKIFTVNQ